MPYIKPDERKQYDDHISGILDTMALLGKDAPPLGHILETLSWGYCGQLPRAFADRAESHLRALWPACTNPDTPTGHRNYIFSALAKGYVMMHGRRYVHMEAVIGAFEYAIRVTGDAETATTLRCAQLEFYRVEVAPYEDVKCQEHGPVPDLTAPRKEAEHGE